MVFHQVSMCCISDSVGTVKSVFFSLCCYHMWPAEGDHSPTKPRSSRRSSSSSFLKKRLTGIIISALNQQLVVLKTCLTCTRITVSVPSDRFMCEALQCRLILTKACEPKNKQNNKQTNTFPLFHSALTDYWAEKFVFARLSHICNKEELQSDY